MPGTFEVKTAQNGQFFFRLKSGNGEIILASEMYKAKASALNGIESVKKNAPTQGRFEKKSGKGGKFYFVLKAANSQVIGTSEQYNSEASCDNGIQSVMRNAPGASVQDQTAASA